MEETPETVALNGITKDLQNLAEQIKSSSLNFDNFDSEKDLRNSVLKRLEQFVVLQPSKNGKRLMEYVWKKVCYPQISKIRPYLELNSTKYLSPDDKKRAILETLFLKIIGEFLQFFKNTEATIANKTTSLRSAGDSSTAFLKETQLMCNIWCGDLYRYLYGCDTSATNFDTAVHYYRKAFLVNVHNDSSYNQLGVLYKIKEDYFMSMFYLIKGCLYSDDKLSLIWKNKEITYVALNAANTALLTAVVENSNTEDREIKLYKYGVIILVCSWLSTLKGSATKKNVLLSDTKALQEKLILNMINRLQFMNFDDLNSELNDTLSLKSCLVYVCVLLIFSVEKLRKLDSTTFRGALELLIDFIYHTTKYTVAVIDHIYGLKTNLELNQHTENDDGLDSNEEFVASQYKTGYICGRRAVRNVSSKNFGCAVDSESEICDDDNHIVVESLEDSFSSEDKKKFIKLNYALDHACIDVLKIIVEWLPKSYHVIPVIDEISNDSILKYLRKNVNHIRRVLSLMGLDEKNFGFDNKFDDPLFPEDLLVLDHHIFAGKKIDLCVNFDLLKKPHEFSQVRVAFLGRFIDCNRVFQEGEIERLMKSLECTSNSTVIVGPRKNSVLATNRRNRQPQNKARKLKADSPTRGNISVAVTVNSGHKVCRIVKPSPASATQSTSTNPDITVKTPTLCIFEYGSIRDSLYSVRKALKNLSLTFVVTANCINKLDFHKKNCMNAREGAKFIEAELSARHGRLLLQDESQVVTFDMDNYPEGLGKYFIPLIECALYYRKHTTSTVDIIIVLSYRDFKRIQQNKMVSDYLDQKLIQNNINYTSIDGLAKRK